ncbi:MAG: hypothetical protein K6E91_06605 [Butyrivibrio sp.]|nr:hypothetical protein [Butyrivibrio sp.]
MEVIFGFLATAVEIVKDFLNKALAFWRSLDEDKKRLCIYCAAALICISSIASFFYSLGRKKGEEAAAKEEF